MKKINMDMLEVLKTSALIVEEGKGRNLMIVIDTFSVVTNIDDESDVTVRMEDDWGAIYYMDYSDVVTLIECKEVLVNRGTPRQRKVSLLPVKRQSNDKQIRESYLNLKNRHPEAVLLFRRGNKYYMYYEDSKVGHDILSLEIKNRTGDRDEVSFGHLDLDTYLPRLIRRGCRVAICDDIANQ